MSREPSGASREQGNEINFQDCPACGNSNWKVYMNPDNGLWFCHRCTARGKAKVDTNVNTLMEAIKPRVEYEWAEIPLPEYTPLTRTARKYLKDRGIHRPEKFGIVSLADGPRVLIPYRGTEGRIIHWTTRSFADDGRPKYITAPGRSPFYVLPKWSPRSDVTFVEGVFDCIVYHLATGRPAIAIGGKNIPRYSRACLDFLAPDKRTVMLDSDATVDAVRLAREFGMKLKMLPGGTDPADYYKGRIRDD